MSVRVASGVGRGIWAGWCTSRGLPLLLLTPPAPGCTVSSSSAFPRPPATHALSLYLITHPRFQASPMGAGWRLCTSDCVSLNRIPSPPIPPISVFPQKPYVPPLVKMKTLMSCRRRVASCAPGTGMVGYFCVCVAVVADVLQAPISRCVGGGGGQLFVC